MKKIATFLLNLILIMQISSCGTIFYQDRHGQKSGKIDVNVALLNGIGLLFYIVPGVIAFIVDYQTGAIYLPNRKTSYLNVEELHNTISVNQNIHLNKLEILLSKETGQYVYLQNAEIKAIN